MSKPILYIVVFLLLFQSKSWSQIQLLENKGQYPDQYEFVGNVPGGRAFFAKNQVTYQFTEFDYVSHDHEDHMQCHVYESGIHKVNGHSYSIRFLEANSDVSVSARNPDDHQRNYYVGDKEKWVAGVRDYNQVVFNEIYEGIDLTYYKYEGTLKYDFVVSPGFDPSAIALELNALNDYYIDEQGNLHLLSSVSEVIETKPVTYQLTNNQKRIIDSEFKLDENVLSFNVYGEYDTLLPLIIDPTLIFSTYSGSTADNWGNTATFDERGNLYSGGITSHYAGGNFPTTEGAFQTTTAGLWDVAITKYDSTGSDALYSTYLGGNQTEVPQSLVVNENNELLILGVTGSSNFPTANGFQDFFSGGPSIFPFGEGENNLLFPNGSDLFITKLSVDGMALESSTFFGGTGNDGLSEPGDALVNNYGDQSRGDIFVNASGSIAFVSTTSSSDLPLQNELQSKNTGDYDAVIVEMSSDLSSLNFSSYLGGSAMDAAYTIKENSEQKYIIGGGTVSNDINDNLSSFSDSTFSSVNGWMAIIDPINYELDTGIYIGTNDYDQLYFLDLDADDNIYTYGQTSGSFPIIGDVFTSGSGQFVQKWQSDLKQLIASTRFGSPGSRPDISPTAFLVNDCDNIYLSGWGGDTNDGYNGGSTNSMPISSDAFQSTTSGSDFYLMTLSADLSEFLYGTYLGGTQSKTHVDGGTSRFDKQGIVYHAVCAGCAGRNETEMATSDFPTTENAWSRTNNSNNCNNAAFKFDLATLRARIQTNNITRTDPGITNICLSDAIVYENLSIGGTEFQWSFGDGAILSSTDTTAVVYTYQNPGTYRVTLRAVDLSTCVGQDIASVQVRVNSPLFTVQEDEIICEGDEVILNAQGASSYFWFNQDSTFQSNDANPSFTAEISDTYFVQLQDGRGCSDFDTVNVNVVPGASLNFSLTKESDCFSRTRLLLNDQSELPEGYDLSWSLGDGQVSNQRSLAYNYGQDGIYQINLIAENDLCRYQKSQSVSIITVLAPNVFTPNNDGYNDFFEIVTEAEVSISIFNRWGKKVYEQDSYENNWNGEELASGVYYYEAEIKDEFTCNGWVQILK